MRIGISIPVRDLQDDHEGMARFRARGGGARVHAPARARPRRGRWGVDHVHEPLTLLAWGGGAHTSTIELVPSVIVLPTRQTVVVAKQAAENRPAERRAAAVRGGGGGARAEDYAGVRTGLPHARAALLRADRHPPAGCGRRRKVHFEGRWDRLAGGAHQPAAGAAAHPHLDRRGAGAGGFRAAPHRGGCRTGGSR